MTASSPYSPTGYPYMPQYGYGSDVTAGWQARGSIVAVAAASLLDGETFTISSWSGGPVTYEFDVAGDGVVAGNIAILTAGLVTAADVAGAMLSAIQSTNAVLAWIDPAVPGTVELQSHLPTSAANLPVTETVADAGFVADGMAYGEGFRPVTPLLPHGFAPGDAIP